MHAFAPQRPTPAIDVLNYTMHTRDMPGEQYTTVLLPKMRSRMLLTALWVLKLSKSGSGRREGELDAVNDDHFGARSADIQQTRTSPRTPCTKRAL